jgi:hypothetical protein
MALNGLITFFTGNEKNRRKYARRAGPHRAWMADGKAWVAVTCLDISGSGLGLVSPTEMRGDEASFRVMLDERPVLIRAKRAWAQPGTAHGKTVWRYGLAFTGISADDWDAVVRFSSGGSATEVENVAQKELESVRLQADDVARLIPKKLQDQLLAMLVERRRLAPIEPTKNPLVQYFYGGVIKKHNISLHRLSIHSRILDPETGKAEAYDTRFYFDDAGNNVNMD